MWEREEGGGTHPCPPPPPVPWQLYDKLAGRGADQALGDKLLREYPEVVAALTAGEEPQGEGEKPQGEGEGEEGEEADEGHRGGGLEALSASLL